LDGMHNLDNFFDAILVFSMTFEEHLEVLNELFTRLKGANLTARPSLAIQN